MRGGGNTPYKKYDLVELYLDSKDSSKSIAVSNKSTTNQSVDSIDSHDSPNLKANQSTDLLDSLESSTNLKIVFLPKRFYPKRAFLKQISDNQNLWLSSNPKSALIIIDIKAKGYFLRKSLPKHISLIGYDDKKILIRYSFAFDDEIFNFLKIWIPYARIKEPKELQIRFNEILEKYVREVREKLGSQGDLGESMGESKMDSSEVKGESKANQAKHNDLKRESKGIQRDLGESKRDSIKLKPNQTDSTHESKDS